MELQCTKWADCAGAQEALGDAEQRGEERRGARRGLGDSICPVALSPANDKRELVYLYLPHIWYLEMSSLSGIRKAKNIFLICITQGFSRLTLLKLNHM